jgi:hypothetical protein
MSEVYKLGIFMKFDSLEAVLLGDEAWACELTMDELAFVGGGYGSGYGSAVPQPVVNYEFFEDHGRVMIASSQTNPNGTITGTVAEFTLRGTGIEIPFTITPSTSSTAVLQFSVTSGSSGSHSNSVTPAPIINQSYLNSPSHPVSSVATFSISNFKPDPTALAIGQTMCNALWGSAIGLTGVVTFGGTTAVAIGSNMVGNGVSTVMCPTYVEPGTIVAPGGQSFALNQPSTWSLGNVANFGCQGVVGGVAGIGTNALIGPASNTGAGQVMSSVWTNTFAESICAGPQGSSSNTATSNLSWANMLNVSTQADSYTTQPMPSPSRGSEWSSSSYSSSSSGYGH